MNIKMNYKNKTRMNSQLLYPMARLTRRFLSANKFRGDLEKSRFLKGGRFHLGCSAEKMDSSIPDTPTREFGGAETGHQLGQGKAHDLRQRPSPVSRRDTWGCQDSLVTPKLLLCCADVRVLLKPFAALVVREGVSHRKGHGQEALLLLGVVGILDLLEFEGQHLLPVFTLWEKAVCGRGP